MKQAIKTGLAALVLLLAISCKKENSTIQTSSIDINNSEQSRIPDTLYYAGKAIGIGTQVWMTKNLDVSHYRNGDPIPQVTDPIAWAALTTGAWCYYPAAGAIYGKLYNWYAVNDPRGLAPAGWHVPSDAEWTTLTTFLGGEAVAGGKMKETGTTHWTSPNYGATNSSGFTGLPGGFCYIDGTFNQLRYWGFWWSSTENYYINFADIRSLTSNYGNFPGGGYYNKHYGLSVRCVKN
ncbi:MAG TPA: fibrobacter succinogenes major paralogous domain-containing protein [Panacibacter sp.]|nr:fibrobacter succinogenes major paralogous domain-containing protein [Panacibacter sp.]